MNNPQRSEAQEAASLMAAQGLGELESKAVQFVGTKRTFYDVEVATVKNDFIFHFYKPKNIGPIFDALGIPTQLRSGMALLRYWEDTFANALDLAARTYFKAEAPRLVAQHVHDPDVRVGFAGNIDLINSDGKVVARGDEREMDSWWLLAKGFAATTFAPDTLVERFYEALDQALLSTKRR